MISKKRKIELLISNADLNKMNNKMNAEDNKDEGLNASLNEATKSNLSIDKADQNSLNTIQQKSTNSLSSSSSSLNHNLIKLSGFITDLKSPYNQLNSMDSQTSTSSSNIFISPMYQTASTDLHNTLKSTPNSSLKNNHLIIHQSLHKIDNQLKVSKFHKDLFEHKFQSSSLNKELNSDVNLSQNLTLQEVDSLIATPNLEDLNKSHSNLTLDFSFVNENSNSSSNSSEFEYLDLNDKSLNLTRPPNLDQWLDMFHNWTHNERLTALESLVDSEICDIQQIRFLLSIIEPQLQRDFISLLPKELALYVLSFLEPKDLCKAAQTCRYWRILCEDNLLWREKCKEYGLKDEETLCELFRKRAVRNALNHHNSNCVLTPPTVSPAASPSLISPNCNNNNLTNAIHKPTSNLIFNLTNLNNVNSKLQTTPFQRSDYKLAYLKQRAIEHNWRYGRFPNESDNLNTNNNSTNNAPKGRLLKEILHLKGHDDHVITCLQFNHNSNIIVSGSDDNTLKVWSSENGRCLQTLTGHSGGVWSSALGTSESMNDNIVISGSTDRTLKIWNALTGECLHTLYGHTSTVRCMALHGNYVVSGSRDMTLRVWDITTGECVHQLTGHQQAVRCVQFNGEIVVSGAYDFMVKVWDVKSETCLHTLAGHTNRVYSLQFDGINIVSGSLDTSIKVWNAKTGALKHTLVGHQSLTSGMQLKGSILVSGNADSTVKIWDVETGDCLQTLAGPNKHLSAVTCLQFNSNFVITSSDDGTVKLWELKTGEFIRNLISLPSGGSGGVVWRIRASNTKLICAIGSRNGTEDTALMLIDFSVDDDNGC